MEYSEKTKKLIERIKKVALRQEYVFDKEKIAELVEKSYKMFNLKVPQKIEWCVDITDKRFLEAAYVASAAWATGATRAAWAAWDASATNAALDTLAARVASATRAAWAARTALDTRAARVASAAWAAWAAWDTLAARVASAAWAARVASAAWAAWAASAASDYNWLEFLFAFEFLQTNKGNENDYKFIESQELFLQAKEAGIGYWAEKDGKLYIAPNPIISLNERLQFHSETKPAIRWENGLELFFLFGVRFEKDLWEKITKKKIKPLEILKIKNQEQKIIALKMYGWDNLLKELNYKVLDEKYLLINGEPLKHQVLEINQNGWIGRFLKYTDPADKAEGLLRVDHRIDETKSVEGARQWGFRPVMRLLGVDSLEFGREG